MTEQAKQRVRRPSADPLLPCPECRRRGAGGQSRIGNRKGDCRTCNRFAQAVRRGTLRRLKQEHAEDYRRLLVEVEDAEYQTLLEGIVIAQMEAERADRKAADDLINGTTDDAGGTL